MSDGAIEIDARTAISRVRRAGVLAGVLRIVLLAGVAGGFVLTAAGQQTVGMVVMAIVIAALFMLAGRSMRAQQTLARASGLIGTGQYEEAEKTLDEGLRAFVIYRSPRLGLLQNLAALRHAQGRFPEAATLSRELLRYRRSDSVLTRTLRLMLAECALEMNDLPAAHAALQQIPPQLPMREMLKLMELQVDYCVRISAWQAALDQLGTKIELSELLPAEVAARVQALLALAALKLGRNDWSAWLKRRAELLTDVPKLVQTRGVLAELWPSN
jgi:tetratricopeptide (TPR) repeat protein